ncbi:MAG TPA: helix-turn-helix transcriptional regulator [Acidimicrobiales bacterium]|nr:helix-turn-helix transcriptional regulator [Acidimicrobiales bacterium]
MGRSTSYVHAVLSGWWASDQAFVSAVSEFLGVPREGLFTSEFLEASPLPGEPRLAPLAQARRARVGRFGRQPVYWILRERRLTQVKLCRVTGQDSSYVSMVLNGSRVPSPSFLDVVSGFLGLAPSELFTVELVEASRTRIDDGRPGPPPSQRVGPYGRQPAYWRLRECGIRQHSLAARLGRTSGHVSKVLNGFILPDRRFVEEVSDALGMVPTELFTHGLE